MNEYILINNNPILTILVLLVGSGLGSILGIMAGITIDHLLSRRNK